MNTWIISDTHGLHNQLIIPDEIDCVIHCGDSTNSPGLVENNIEYLDFIEWFINLPIKHKVLIAGNHDTWATKKYNINYVKDNGIIYLEHEYYELDGLLLFGSPYTPTFGNWNFMVNRSKLGRYWDVLEPNIDILITHGPPRRILDIGYDINDPNRKNIEYCGDSALFKKVMNIKPLYHCFGHIHDQNGIINGGIRVYNDITFVNAAVSSFENMKKPKYNGYIFDI